MSVILDLLYREYCRARLSEMRKQLLLSVANDEIPAADRDGAATKQRTDSGAGPSDRGALGEAARYLHTSATSRPT